MNKKLFTQITNEWRSNLWLALELLVVSVVMWYVTDYLYARTATYLEPRGFDIEHCYLITMGRLTDKSPDFIPNQTNKESSADVEELMERLRRHPDIEVVSLSQNSYPYNGSNSGDRLQLPGDTLQSKGYFVRREVTPDFVRVFRYQGTQGETPEQLAQMLEAGDILVGDNTFQHYGKRMTSYVGQRFYLHGDTTRTYRLGASIQPVRYYDYQQARESFFFLQRLTWYDSMLELCIRVRADRDVNFIDRLRDESEKQFRVGNVFISDVRSFHDIRRNFQQMWSNEMRNYYTGMGFLLLNIFLGLLGTFWFRTQQRQAEIALHKAHGATDRAVFFRLLSEGWFLLLLVTPLAWAIDFNLGYMELNQWRNGTTLEAGRFLICAGVTWLLMALMIAIGIGIPARKAMKIQPAEALHNE